MARVMTGGEVLECVAHQNGVQGWAYIAWLDANGWHYVASVRRPARVGGGWVVVGRRLGDFVFIVVHVGKSGNA